ncbi:MAG: putative toxin-antitoxin system toxin component, PIN family [Candidatus Omnitrophica bacterium]|nr:putative toxin-antitoxin system toxin component, PIN family [Candidatus Omnitrophota bacterium]
MIKAVLDTNVVVSGLLWTGVPREILRAAEEERFFLFSSKELLEELALVLCRPQFKRFLERRGLDFKDALAQMVRMARLVVSRPFSEVIIAKDPSDDQVLACAVTAAANVIVTGDEHLLDLKKFRGIQIITPAIFFQRSLSS